GHPCHELLAVGPVLVEGGGQAVVMVPRDVPAHRPTLQAISQQVSSFFWLIVKVKSRSGSLTAVRALPKTRRRARRTSPARSASVQPRHILPHPSPRLGTRETAPDPLMHAVQLDRDQVHHHAPNDPLWIMQVPLQY